MRLAPLVHLALLAALACASSARGQEVAPPDSLGRFLDELSDSTDAYFGDSAVPTDTAGLDTVLFDSAERPTRRFGLGATPTFAFNRVDGSTPGVSAWLGEERPDPLRTGWGRLQLNLARANGPRTNLGGVRFTDRVWLGPQPFDLELWGGRRTSNLDRDEGERLLRLARAFVFGSDWTQYYRTDGVEASLVHPHDWWRAALGYQDVLQRPLDVTATWNLLGRDLDMPLNLPAARGRVREVSGALAARLPGLPVRVEAGLHNASRRLGGDFDYRRVRGAVGLDLSLGRFASLVPQLAYGRLAGDALPQASFYLGGDGTLRSLRRDERAGTGMAMAKLELVGAQPVLPLALLPMVPEAFFATGTTWGSDPWLGSRTPRDVSGDDRAWPEAREWRSEVGVGLVYASPIFPQGAALHVDHAWPVGGHAGAGRWSVSFTRPFDLLGPEPEPIEER